MGRQATDEEVEEVWKEFWLPIVAPNGALEIEQVKKELFDFHRVMGEVPKVYMHVSGNQFSKVTTMAEYVMTAADEHYRKLYEPDLEPADDDGELITNEWWEAQPDVELYWGRKVIVLPSESNLTFRDGWLSILHRSDEHELIQNPTRGQYRKLLDALDPAA